MAIGPSFSDELAAAGLIGLPFSWASDGTINGRENLTQQQNTALDAVITAHNPATPAAAKSLDDAFNNNTNRQDFINQIKTATPAQVTTYITNNVTDLASARAMLIKLALLVIRHIRN